MFTHNKEEAYMNPEQPIQPSKKRLALVIGVSVVAVVASFALTVIILKSVTPPKSTPSTPTTSSTATPASIDQVVAAYPDSIASFKNNYQRITSNQANIYYKQTGKAYGITLMTTKAITYVASTPNTAAASLPDEVTSFFTAKGYTPQPTNTNAKDTITYKTFTNSDSVCQVGLTTPSAKTVQVVTLGCASVADIAKEYSFIDQLLTLYAKNNPKPDFTQESRNLVTSDNKSLSIVRLTGGRTQPSLLFAAIDNKWEYIATLSTGDSTESNGKYVPSEDLTAALNNPKYGTFLKDNIQ